MRLASRLVLGGLVTMVACKTADPAPPMTTATPTVTVPGLAPSASQASSVATGACAPWPGAGFSLTTRTGGGRGDFFRELGFDDAKGTVTVHDSDVFMDGKELPTPRVTKETRTLSEADHAALRRNLLAICPDAATLVRRDRELTGGASPELKVTWPGGHAEVYDYVSVARVMGLLEPFFPGLRVDTKSSPAGLYDVVLTEKDKSTPIGAVRLSRTAEMTVVSATADRAEWLSSLVDRTNREALMHQDAAPPPDAPRFTDASRLIKRTDPEFTAALLDELRKYYGVELRKR
jgi:hypothetical protein